MRAVCDATTEMLAALADHKDAAPDGATAAGGAANDAQAGLAGRSVVCFPGSGPLDGAVAMMGAQLLRRAGCEVREQSRDRLRGAAAELFDPGEADTLCILGLFDVRASSRMRRVARAVAERFSSLDVILGVQRSADGGGSGAPGDDPLPIAISAITELVASVRPRHAAVEDAMPSASA